MESGSAGRRSPALAWVPVVVWIAGIWALVPTGRRLYKLIVGLIGRRALQFALLGTGGLMMLRGLAFLPALFRKIGPMRTLAALACLFAYGMALTASDIPEEMLHPLEYLPLALLLERALLRTKISCFARSAAVIAIATVVALSDEGLQSLMPGRVADPWDVWSDVVGAGLPIAFLRLTGLEVPLPDAKPGNDERPSA